LRRREEKMNEDRWKNLSLTMKPYLPFFLIAGILLIGEAGYRVRQMQETPPSQSPTALVVTDGDLSYVPPEGVSAPKGSAGAFAPSGISPAALAMQEAFDPIQLAVSPSGEAYFIQERQICKIDKRGRITSFAGERGSVGPKAEGVGIFKRPVGLAFDPKGYLFIVDMEDHRVRRIDPRGKISTVAGVGPCGVDRYGRIVGGSAGAEGPATLAQLNFPRAVACDAKGDVFIGDKGRLCVVGPDGLLRHIAGDGEERFRNYSLAMRSPALETSIHVTNIAMGPDGCVYFSDDVHHLVRKLTPNGELAVVAGNPRMNSRGARMAGFSGDGGPATQAELSAPSGIAFDAKGDLYIADKGNGRIRVVDRKGIIRTAAGKGDRPDALSKDFMGAETLYKPSSLAFNPKGDLYFIDAPAHRIYEKKTDGQLAILGEPPRPDQRATVFVQSLPGDLPPR
jgi:sugar lactone lactonase YvrE